MHSNTSKIRPDFDPLIQAIAAYAQDTSFTGSELARTTARQCLIDSLGCGLLALNYPECVKLLGPIVPNAEMPNGVKIPGTKFQLDPVRAAFNLGAMIRWLDYNDTWLAAEWGHPSDNLGGILACADYMSRKTGTKTAELKIADILSAMIKAHEIQGVLALENAFNRVGLDHVLLVRIATTAVCSVLLGADSQQTLNAVSNAWVDGPALRVYRHAPNAGPRKSWAAGDASSRGVFLSLVALTQEMGYPTAISTKTWGFQDVFFKSETIKLSRPFASYVMENVLFKIAFPAEFHAQTAVECGIILHPKVKPRLDAIEKITIHSQESALRIIDKPGPLNNPADRDHCIRYMTAVALLRGGLKADDYSDVAAQDPTIDFLRNKMQVIEDKRFSKEYLDPDKRSIGNAVQVFFKDGTSTEKVSIDYPLGHRLRRKEGLPILEKKFVDNLCTRFDKARVENIFKLYQEPAKFDNTPISEFIDMFWCGP